MGRRLAREMLGSLARQPRGSFWPRGFWGCPLSHFYGAAQRDPWEMRVMLQLEAGGGGRCSSVVGGLSLMGFLHPPFPNCLHIAKLCVWTPSPPPPSSFAFDRLVFQEKASEFNVGLFQDLARLTKFSGSRPLAGSPALIPCLLISPVSWEEDFSAG